MAKIDGIEASSIVGLGSIGVSAGGSARVPLAGVIYVGRIVDNLSLFMADEGGAALEQLYAQTSTTSHNFTKIVSNQYEQFWGLKADGTLWHFHHGNTFSSYGTQTTWTQLGSDTDWEDIAAGQYSTYAIKNGELFAYGYNVDGQQGRGNTTTYTSFTSVSGFTTGCELVSGGRSWSIVVKSGAAYTAGQNLNYRTGQGTQSGDTTTYTQLTGFSNVIAVFAGYRDGLLIEEATAGDGHGAVYGWGYNNANNMGMSGTKTTPTLTSITSNATVVTKNDVRSMIIKNDGTQWYAGYSTGNLSWIATSSSTGGAFSQDGSATDHQYVQLDGPVGTQYIGVLKKNNKHYIVANNLNGFVLNGQTSTAQRASTVDAIEDWTIWSDNGLTVDRVNMTHGYNTGIFITVS
jgi:hypothetical protein